MPTELLQKGMSVLIADNAPRALPTGVVRIFVQNISATSIDLSNSSDMSNPVNITPTGQAFKEGGTDNSAGFIRVNGGSAVLNIERY
jgi:hypothetical protein